eukprot:6677336-Pyramimonas_sp.AAC.1
MPTRELASCSATTQCRPCGADGARRDAFSWIRIASQGRSNLSRKPSARTPWSTGAWPGQGAPGTSPPSRGARTWTEASCELHSAASRNPRRPRKQPHTAQTWKPTPGTP